MNKPKSERLQNHIFACALKLQLAFKSGREWVPFKTLAEMLDPTWRSLGPGKKRAAIADIKRHMVDIRDLAHDSGLYISLANNNVRADRRGRILNAPTNADDAFKLTAYKRGTPIVGFAMCANPAGNGFMFVADGRHRQSNAQHIVRKHAGRENDAVEAGFVLKSTLKMFPTAS
jgi:hypothetical protein